METLMQEAQKIAQLKTLVKCQGKWESSPYRKTVLSQRRISTI
jgi:hypothetical protein